MPYYKTRRFWSEMFPVVQRQVAALGGNVVRVGDAIYVTTPTDASLETVVAIQNLVGRV